jgi:hypothetical protein
MTWGYVRVIVFSAMAVTCLRADFLVTSTNPADGALVQPFSSLTANFNQTINVGSVNASDFTINGVNATSVTVSPGDTQATFSFSPSAIPAGDRVTNTLDISGVQDVMGDILVPFAATIVTDSVPPSVVASSIPNGAILPTRPLTEVFTFSEPINTAFTTAASFDLHGFNHAANYTPASFSWDPTGTILTINYSNLLVDNYKETLFASGFKDLVGLDLTNNFAVSFCASDNGACPAPTTVPEPATVRLFALGALVLGALHRRSLLGRLGSYRESIRPSRIR